MIDPAFAQAARSAPFLSAECERDLITLAQRGDCRARDRLVRSHLRLVIAEASKRKGYRVPPDDLVQEGCAGLVQAVDKFDVTHSVRFGTYAQWWIKAAMNDAAMRGHSIVKRSSTAQGKAMFFGLRRARAELERRSDVAEHEIDDLLAARFGVDSETIRTMSVHLAGGDCSMNAPVSDGGAEFGELIAETCALPDEVVSDAIDGCRQRERLQTAIDVLNDRERAIILARRYVDDEDEQTLDQLAVRFGITKERVRQIEVRALEKMKALLTGSPMHRRRGPTKRSTRAGTATTASIVAAARVDCPQAERVPVTTLCQRLGVSGARVYQIESGLRRQREATAA